MGNFFNKYCFVNLRPEKDGEGSGPDFPEGISFLLLADCATANWGLYEFSRDEETEGWIPESPVSRELEALLESGKRYPPALALARDRVSEVFRDTEPTQQEFAAVFADSIRHHLSRQSTAKYLLAPALKDDFGYLFEGEWYWVLGRTDSEPEMVDWVSDDFFVYHNPVTDFDLTEEQVRCLDRGEP